MAVERRATITPLVRVDVPVMARSALPAMGGAWRIEVTARGRYWQWRRGRGKARESRYGGRFASLPDQRKEQYKARVAARTGIKT